MAVACNGVSRHIKWTEEGMEHHSVGRRRDDCLAGWNAFSTSTFDIVAF
jgi:hypothetical protein